MINLPVTVGGNAVSVIGDSESSDATTVVDAGSGSGSGGDAWTSGEGSILGGTQVVPDLSLPVTIGGNAVSVIGDSTTGGSTTVVTPGGPGEPVDPVDPVDPAEPGDPTEPGDPATPGTTGDGGVTVPTESGAAVVVTGATAGGAGASALASTGLDAGYWERLALFLLLTGALLVGLRRFALRG